MGTIKLYMFSDMQIYSASESILKHYNLMIIQLCHTGLSNMYTN